MITPEQIASFRVNGFVSIPGVITKDEAAHFYAAALDYTRRNPPLSSRPVFDQHVNVWTHDEAMKALTLHPNLGAVAKALNGTALRLWHDQILIKQPTTTPPRSSTRISPTGPTRPRPILFLPGSRSVMFPWRKAA